MRVTVPIEVPNEEIEMLFRQYVNETLELLNESHGYCINGEVPRRWWFSEEGDIEEEKEKLEKAIEGLYFLLHHIGNRAYLFWSLEDNSGYRGQSRPE